MAGLCSVVFWPVWLWPTFGFVADDVLEVRIKTIPNENARSVMKYVEMTMKMSMITLLMFITTGPIRSCSKNQYKTL